MILPIAAGIPVCGKSVFVAPSAWVIGDITLGDNVSIFFGAVLRGDILPIRVGHRTNIQEHALLHTSGGRTPTIVGDNVTIGHRAIVHGCSIGNSTLIGMGAIVLDEAEVGDNCLVAAGTVITEGKKIPPRSMVMGVPGKIVRELRDDEVARLLESAENYVRTGEMYLREFAQIAGESVPQLVGSVTKI